MGPARSRTLSLIVFLFLAAISLQPWTRFDEGIELAFEPARWLGNLARPLAWLSRGEVRAAETALLADEEARREAGRAVLYSAQSRAAPREDALAQGRGLVHAEIYERLEEDPDRVLVRFAPGTRVESGMPVVCGDFYVGRVVSVRSVERGEASVDLVTGKDFRVGAVVEGAAGAMAAGAIEGAGAPRGSSAGSEATSPSKSAGGPPLLVVGGVVPRGRPGEPGHPGQAGSRDILLAVHCPSDASVSAGLVRVLETDPVSGDTYARLADGFLLGSLERTERDRASFLALRPGLDYSDGLYQVAIVCPADRSRGGTDLARDPFDDEPWIDVQVGFPGDPTFWREGRVLRAGKKGGLEDGSALALGATFLGCVVDAGQWTSKASLLGDAGVAISALASPVDDGLAPVGASLAPAGPPIAIGRLLSLGRDRSTGEVLLRWDAAIPLPRLPSDGERQTLPVVLYTAAGQRAVPPGLCVGRTELPRGRGPFVLRVRQEESGLALTSVRAWRDPTRIPSVAKGSPP